MSLYTVFTLNFYSFQAKVWNFNQISQLWEIIGSKKLEIFLRAMEGICRPNIKNYLIIPLKKYDKYSQPTFFRVSSGHPRNLRMVSNIMILLSAFIVEDGKILSYYVRFFNVDDRKWYLVSLVQRQWNRRTQGRHHISLWVRWNKEVGTALLRLLRWGGRHLCMELCRVESFLSV